MTLSRNKSGSSHHSNTSNLNNSHGAKTDLNSSANTYFQECADCSSPNANWASLNHGVLICDECCLAHRSLGRCISIIKSLRKSYWPQSLIDVRTFFSCFLSASEISSPLLKNRKREFHLVCFLICVIFFAVCKLRVFNPGRRDKENTVFTDLVQYIYIFT